MVQQIYKGNSESHAGVLQLSDLLLELSTKFINVNSDALEEEITNSLQIIGNYLNFDWVTLYEFPEIRPKFNKIYSYSMPSVNPPPISTIHKDTAGLIEQVKRGKILFTPCIPNDPVLQANSKYQQWEKKFCNDQGLKTTLTLPLITNRTICGALYFTSIREEVAINDNLINRLYCFAKILASVMRQKTSHKQIAKADTGLDAFCKLESDQNAIIGQSMVFKKVLHHAKQVADTDITILLTGETGTGKGIIAKAIHNASKRRDRQMIQINCASLSPGIIESELFGHEKGAFTSAHTKRIGCFERAHCSTLFLDEISELPIELQAKLLRVLQDGEFERVGGSETIKCNVRIIAATNRNLENEIEAGKFRRDLFYRLNIFPVYMPPLRERPDDIPLFVDFFIEKYAKLIGKHFNEIHQKYIEELQNYSWPGNIRELENLLARSVVTSSEDNLVIELPMDQAAMTANVATLVDFEREFILDALNNTTWRIEGPKGAAKRLGLNPSTLRQRMKKLNIQRPMPRI
ncbi:MAG: sigma-54-dependent Fis family transcriptional regulator [Spirochaetes bacterium]|nr:sigma-54-dependent Fis family transcriptional regulator [Spirochaetota bacterium]